MEYKTSKKLPEPIITFNGGLFNKLSKKAKKEILILAIKSFQEKLYQLIP